MKQDWIDKQIRQNRQNRIEWNRIDRQIEMDRWIDGQMDGWMDGQIDR